MSQALLDMLPAFASDFRHALGTNLTLAGDALAQGGAAGALLGVLRLPPGAGAPPPVRVLRRTGARLAGLAVASMRAAPTFVVMYVLLHVLPEDQAPRAAQAVTTALAVYAAAYVSDNLLALLRDRRAGRRSGVLPFAMGVARAYFVMVLSSGFGAAVGVTEATAVTLRALEQLPCASDRLWLMAGVVAVFVALRLLAVRAIAALHAWLRRALA